MTYLGTTINISFNHLQYAYLDNDLLRYHHKYFIQSSSIWLQVSAVDEFVTLLEMPSTLLVVGSYTIGLKFLGKNGGGRGEMRCWSSLLLLTRRLQGMILSPRKRTPGGF